MHSMTNRYGSAGFVALKATRSLASSSCESEVIKILPPRPFSSSSTRSLSEVGFLVRTKSADLLGISTVTNSFMKRSVIPTSASAPEAADAAAAIGFPVALKIRSADIVHKTEAGGVHLNLGSRPAVLEEVIEESLL